LFRSDKLIAIAFTKSLEIVSNQIIKPIPHGGYIMFTGLPNIEKKSNSAELNLYYGCELISINLGKVAEINLFDNRGMTPLHYGVIGLINIVKVLLEKGCEINIKNKDGKSPVHLAAEKGYHQIVKLLENGYEIR